MSLAAYQNSNKSGSSSRARQMNRVQADRRGPGIASRLRKAAVRFGTLLVHATEAIADARVQKAMIEAELYRNRYLHSSKNDDDLPVVR